MSFRSLSALFAVLLCSVMLFLGLSSAPSFAAKASDPTKGTAQMPEVMKAAEDVAKSPPMNMEEIQARGKNGLNEVQGNADADKMYKNDANGEGPAIVQDIEKAAEKVKNSRH